MMNGPFGGLERVAHLRPRITHLADIPQLAPVGSIPNLPRPKVLQAARFEEHTVMAVLFQSHHREL